MSTNEGYLDRLLKGMLGTDDVDSLSTEPISTESLSADSILEESLGTDLVSADSMSADSMSADSTSVDSTSVDSTSVDSMFEESLGTDLVSEDSVSADSLSGDSLFENASITDEMPVIEDESIFENVSIVDEDNHSYENMDISIDDILNEGIGEENALLNPDIVQNETVFSDILSEDSYVENNHADEIPILAEKTDPRMPDLVIDSAPSLEPAPMTSMEEDIADLMADFLPALENEKLHRDNVDDLLTEESINVDDLLTEEPINVDDLLAEESINVDDLLNEESINVDDLLPEESFNTDDLIMENGVSADLESSEALGFGSFEMPDMNSSDMPDLDSSELADLDSSEMPDLDSSEKSDVNPSEMSDLDAFINENSDVLEEESTYDLDSDMSDIDALLAKAQDMGQEVASVNDESQDIMEMMKQSGDDTFEDIADLLHKDENNEFVDPGIEELLHGEAISDDLEAEEAKDSVLDKAALKKAKKEEKKRLKEEKKKAKQLAKEEKASKKKQKVEKTTEELSADDLASVEELLAAANTAAAERPMEDALGAMDAIDNMSGGEQFAGSEDILSIDENGADDVSALLDGINDGQDPFASENELGDPFASDNGLGDPFGASVGGLEDDPFASMDSGMLFGDSQDEGINNFDLGSVNLFGDEIKEPIGLTEAEMDLEIRDKDAEEKTDQKKGLIARIISFLTEEDESPEDLEALKLSDENAEILAEMDAEGDGKKKKKKKDKKGKKGKADAGEEQTSDGSDIPEKEEADKKKKKKEKKPKKEKITDDKPEKKLSAKRVILIFAICISLGVVVFIVANVSGDYSTKKSGRQAYYEGDYETCYQDLYGKKLSETEEVMFNQSQCILLIRLWIREYEILSDESRVKGLDSLIMSIKAYPDLYASAQKWNCETEVSETYNQILSLLMEQYGLTEADALEIAADPDDVSYTRTVTAIAEGNGYSSSGSGDADRLETDAKPVEKLDLLPEETELDTTNSEYLK